MHIGKDPEDFRVEEIPLYPPAGEGEHTFVHLEKRLRTTEDVARDLARAAGVRSRDVGYAGRKDRNAVTSQWFSVPALRPEHAAALRIPGVRLLGAVRHPHKLRTGQLRGNRFRIAVRDVPDALRESLEERLAELQRRGVPNRFGDQRFGRAGDNAERARPLLDGTARRGDRRGARFLLSALQAAVFNRVLEIRGAPLDTVEAGEVAMVHDSGGCFVVEDLAREVPRAAAFEISATGPLFGTKLMEARGAAAERERAVLAEFDIPAELRPPPGLRLRGARRALRVRPDEAAVEFGDGTVVLRFALPPGSYATVFVEELLGEAPRARGSDG